MKIKSFEFSLRELAGSMGDFGTLFPLAIGYISICHMNPAGLLVAIGLANVATGLAYRLPIPIEPMKVIAIIAIAKAWSPSMIFAAAFGMGIVWLLLCGTNTITWIAKITPRSVVRGIQVALGVLLTIEAFKLISKGWWLAIISVLVILLLRQNRYAPAAIVLMVGGLLIALIQGKLTGMAGPAFHLPQITTFSGKEVWLALLAAGFAQIPLTATNAVMATSSMIETYWPERKKVTVRQLSLSTGIMDTASAFIGGMPLCHGAGGLAGQYYFGARTGGANIFEGGIEIGLGLFFASSITVLFGAFPLAILGAMLLMVGVALMKFVKGITIRTDLAPMAATVAVSVFTNMAYGYLAGLAVHYAWTFVDKKWISNEGQGTSEDQDTDAGNGD
ncbi:MAG: putative sulfate/molybdate transporter [Candidatus Geothermincolia bacterium]